MYISKKLSKKAAEKLMELCEKLSLTVEDFDERAVELLASFSCDQALFILTQLEVFYYYNLLGNLNTFKYLIIIY